MLPDVTLDAPQRIHFVGIGGIGMSALALYLHRRGHTITGSDMQENDQVRRLRKVGLPVTVGHAAENVGAVDLVVITAAAPASNPEVAAAIHRGIRVIKRAQLLGSVADGARTVAVAGTHGKTTTTALVGHILRASGIDATVLVGGVVRNTDTNAAVGEDDVMVVEADEYDRSFLWLHPAVAIITNLEYDHPDCYPHFADMVSAYTEFARQVRERCILCGDDAALGALAQHVPAATELYGLTAECDWQALHVVSGPNGSRFSVRHAGAELGEFVTTLRGRYNVANCLGALAAAYALGVDLPNIRAAMATFRGVERRLELRGEVNGVTVLDDYAHHPTEVRVNLDTLRAEIGENGRRLRVIFQPHTYSRTQALKDAFAAAFDAADEVVIVETYAAREQRIAGADGRALAEAIASHREQVSYFAQQQDALRYLADTAAVGDTIVTMGAGDISELGRPLLAELQGKPYG